MLYSGHFSFDEFDHRGNQRHGYFVCIIDAPDPEEATAKFGDHILEMKKKEAAFADMAVVYLEDIIRVETVPESPIVTWLQSSQGEFPKSVSHSLPAVFKKGVAAYGLPSNVDKQESATGGGYKVADPFIRFDE
mgnify:CR=1 FL=1